MTILPCNGPSTANVHEEPVTLAFSNQNIGILTLLFVLTSGSLFVLYTLIGETKFNLERLVFYRGLVVEL